MKDKRQKMFIVGSVSGLQSSIFNLQSLIFNLKKNENSNGIYPHQHDERD
jgi:hypothetical protein